MKTNLPINYKTWDGIPVQKAMTFNEEDRTIEFYGAVWNYRDAGGDILYKGCCAKSILEHGPESNSPQKIVMLAYHDMDKPIGKFVELIEDEYGLLCRVRISDTAIGNDVIQLIKDGVINQFSIGFRYISDKIRKEVTEAGDTWHVYEIKLMEVSAVSIGMNELTRVKGEGNKLEKATEEFLKGYDPDQQIQIRSFCHDWFALGKIEPEPIHSKTSEPGKTDPKVETPSVVDQLKYIASKLNN